MKVLLDNCVPVKFARYLPGHEVIHCVRLGWEKLGNGRLLSAAEEAGFSVLITVDKSIRFQQNMEGRKIAVIHLHVLQNDIDTVKPMAETVLVAMENLVPGTVVRVVHPDRA